MKNPVVIIGLGQIGGVFARGFLSAGYPVFPVTFNMDIEKAAGTYPEPEFVLLAVPENKLHGVLQTIPPVWRDKLGLLQNELLPKDWQDEKIINPTAMAVWFEKKSGRGVNVFQTTPVYGPHAQQVKDSLGAINIPCNILLNPDELVFELVKKNLYVLTINIAGLSVGGTVGDLWPGHQELVYDIANDVLDIQQWLTGKTFDRDKLISAMIKVFEHVPGHNCKGRVAIERLERTLAYAKKAEINTDMLYRIYHQFKQMGS